MKPVFEKIIKSKEDSFSLNEIVLRYFDAPFHFHPEIELTYVLEGNGRRFVGNDVASFQAGDLVLIGKNLPHFWYSNRDYKSESKAIVVQFDVDFLGAHTFDNYNFQHIKNLLKEAQRGILITGKTNGIIGERLKNIFNLNAFDSILELLKILDIIKKSNEIDYLNLTGYTANFNLVDSKRINSICKYVAQHYFEDIKLKFVSNDIANLTVPAFCHYFKKKMGKTFTEFVNEIRIEEAKRLIVSTNKDIASIGFQCGYQSKSNFYKNFKKLNNQSPNQFRKLYHVDTQKNIMF